MGVVREGYHSILERTCEQLLDGGVAIHLSREINRIQPGDNGGINLLDSDGTAHIFDRVLSTIPSPELIRIWPDMPDTYRHTLQSVQYLRLICAYFLLAEPLSPFYVTNLTDPGFPFTGFIEATNIIPPDILDGKALIYLPRYLPPDDPYYNKDEAEILKDFKSGIKRIFPDFREDAILASAIHREPYVQPIQKVNYSQSIPEMATPMNNLFMVNTTMIVNSTLNNNQVIQLARQASSLVENQRSN